MPPGGVVAASRRPAYSRPVWLLGWVSFLTDLASEAIYPLLPAFLSRVLGVGPWALGLVEGVADAANSILKVFAGRLSDRWRVRKPIVLTGYALSGLVRPFMAAVTAWPQVLLLRFLDRVGKGVRGAPRDAMLASLAEPGSRGRVFGFNRAMDHAGAVAGPLVASAFLWWQPEAMRTLFALTLVPGVIVVVLLWRVPEVLDAECTPARLRTNGDPEVPSDATGRSEAATADASWPRTFGIFLVVLLLFTLGNSTDAFLLLRLTEAGVPVAALPALWAGLHVVKSVASLAGGALSDRAGRLTLIVTGWSVYATVYAGFAVATSATTLVVLFLVYGAYYGLSESPEKALVADLVPAAVRGTAFGWYHATTGIGSLLASVTFGALWTVFGAPAAFLAGASLALVAAGALATVARPGRATASAPRYTEPRR